MAGKLIPAQAIEEKIEVLKKLRLELQVQMGRLNTEYDDMEEEQRFYERVLDLAVEPEPGAPFPPPPPQKLPPSDAVLDLVRKHPGISRAEAVERLVAVVETDSDNKPHLLRNTIYNLGKREKLIRTKDDHLFLPNQGPESRNGSSGPKS